MSYIENENYTPRTFYPGWSWFGVSQNINVADYFTSVSENTRVVSQTGYSKYYNTSYFKGWYPNILLQSTYAYKLNTFNILDI